MAINWIIFGIVVIFGIVMLGFLTWGLKRALKLLLNSIIGFFVLWITKAMVLPDLVINIWSVLITAILGIVGYIAVIILHFAGLF